MANGAIEFIQALFTNTWNILRSFYIPGTNLTPAALIVGLFIIKLFSGLIKKLFDIGGSNEKKSDSENA